MSNGLWKCTSCDAVCEQSKPHACPPRKTLTFPVAEYTAVIGGQKSVGLGRFNTEKYDLEEGEVVCALFVGGATPREVRLRILNGGTRVYRARHVPVSQVRRAGYRSVPDFIKAARAYYGESFDEATFTAVIQFEVAA